MAALLQQELTAAVLAANPDVGTCWNRRREALPPPTTDCPRLGAPAGAGRGSPRPRTGLRGVAARPRLLQLLGLAPPRAAAELELVQSAVFTDPQDQSAWTHLRCLLARATPPPRLLCLFVSRREATVAVTFSRPVLVGAGRPALTVTLDGSPLAGTWRSGEGRPRPSHTWLHPFPPDRTRLHFRVTWEPDPAHREVTLLPDENEAWWHEPIVARELFWPEVGVSEPGVLEELAGGGAEGGGASGRLRLPGKALTSLPLLEWAGLITHLELPLDGNPISHASALVPLAACPRLALLRLAETPLAAAPDAAAHLAQLLPHVEVALA